MGGKRWVARALWATAVFLVALASAAKADSIAPQAVPRNIQFTNLSIADGLPQVSVNAILQDHHGYIWIGTQEGLSRHDGYQFNSYYHDPSDPGSLAHDWIWSLLVDRDGTLWVGTDGGGLSRFDEDTGKFRHYRHNPDDPTSLSNDRVRAIVQDRSGMLWIGTDGGGLSRLDPATGRFKRYLESQQAEGILGADKILTISEGRDGRLWVGTAGAGLYRVNPRSGYFDVYRNDPGDPGSISSNNIRAVFEDPSGALWVGTLGNGISLLEPKAAGFRRFRHDPHKSDSLAHDMVRGFYRDREGTLWIATDGGLSQWAPNTGGFLNYSHDRSDRYSLTENRVRALFQDAGGVLWVGTSNGISKWNYLSDAFRYFQKRMGGPGPLNHNTVTSISDARDGSVWIGTYGGGVTRLFLETGKANHYLHDPEDAETLSSDRVMAVFNDKDGNLWAGTRAAGLNRIDARSGKVRRYQHDPLVAGSISSNGITRIFGDADGTLWVGTYGGGLNRMDPASGAFKVFRHDPDNRSSLSSDRVLAVFRDGSGVLWVGTEDGGLNALDETNDLFRRYRHEPSRSDSLSSDTAWEILEGLDGSLWIGTNGGGLNRWLPEDRKAGRAVFKTYGKRNGLLGGTVQGLLQDKAGDIWISSNRGLSHLDPKTDQVRNFDAQNGLVIYDFMHGAHAITENGQLLFGSTEGLVVFSADRIVSNTHRPSVVVTAYRRMVPVGSAFSNDDRVPGINLSYTDYSITFEFSALDYTSSDKNTYRYRLEGFDKDWVDAGHYRRVTYTNLPAGSFRFQVEGANNDGMWGEQSADLSLHVSPPPWRSPWAYSFYTALVLGAVMLYLRSHKRKIAKEAQDRSELEEQVRRRTFELSERNAELVSLTDQLRLASVTDSLTGLKNRRYLDEFIHPEVAQVDRLVKDRRGREAGKSMPDIFPGLFFMMIDLDGFKLINDTHGHNAGDQALLQVCEVLNRCCRASDTVIRMGGDEFLLVGHGSTRSSIEKLAERIRTELAAHRYLLGEQGVGRLSASIGISIYPFVCANCKPIGWERVVAIADQAAYLAKENQRNAWVGIYPGPKAVSMEAYESIGDRLNELAREGAIEIRTSIQKEIAVFSQKKTSVSA